MSCSYVTILDRECGRPATNGEHCDLHYVLAQIDAYAPGTPAVVVVPPSVKPMVEHLLGTVVEYWHVQRPGNPFEPWNMNLLGLTTASMNRRVALRQMNEVDLPSPAEAPRLPEIYT